MERLFFGGEHVRIQNFTRASKHSKIAVPGFFVQYKIGLTPKYSCLDVVILCERPEPDLATIKAEFRGEVDDFLKDALGLERWHGIIRALALPPRWTCVRVCPTADTSDTIQCLQQEVEGFNRRRPQPSSVLRPYPHSAMKNFYRLDFAPPDSASLATPPKLSVVVDTKCGEAVLRGADVFAPGVRGASGTIADGALVSVLADIDSQVLHGDKEIVSNRLLFIGVGIARMSRAQMISAGRTGVAVQMITRPTGDAPGLGDTLPGRIYLQNLPSCVVGIVLDAHPGDLVLDMCSSPGGKTSHVADLMEERGILVACDRTVNKCLPVRATCDTFARTKGVSSIVRVCQSDSAKPCIGLVDFSLRPYEDRASELRQHLSQLESDRDILLLPPGSLPKGVFDRILLDGPCSALGLRPRFSHIDMTKKMLEAHGTVQRLMLYNALCLVRVGGTIVYSTCTINPIENEDVVKWVLTNYADYVTLVEAEPRIGGPGLESILGASNAQKVQRFDPSDDNLDCMGFFIAKFIKVRALDAVVRFKG